MVVLTKLCIQLIPLCVSFFLHPLSLPILLPHLVLFDVEYQIFAEVVIVFTPIPRFTNPWTSKPSSRFNFISATHPCALLSPINIILCFFFACVCFFPSVPCFYFHFSPSAVPIDSHAISSLYSLLLSRSY